MNNMQQGVQTDATCNTMLGSCWPTMLRPFARGFSVLNNCNSAPVINCKILDDVSDAFYPLTRTFLGVRHAFLPY